jgi:hypothetical protein
VVIELNEWEWCPDRVRSLHGLIADLEARTSDCAREQVLERLRALLNPEVVAFARP